MYICGVFSRALTEVWLVGFYNVYIMLSLKDYV